MNSKTYKHLKEHLQELTNPELVFEMAMPRKKFKESVNNLMLQIFENWCLVHYCTLTGRTETKNHWKNDELRSYLTRCAKFKMQGNDSYKSRHKALEEIWRDFEYWDIETMDDLVSGKFFLENIETEYNLQYDKTIQDCIDAGPDIIDLIAMADVSQIQSYINSI